MKYKLNIQEIGRLLNRSAALLDRGILNQLQSARRAALLHQQTEQQAPVLAWLNEHGLIHHHSTPVHKAYNLGMATLLAAILLGGALYLQQSYEHDHSDIDIAILTDDLPVDMYVD